MLVMCDTHTLLASQCVYIFTVERRRKQKIARNIKTLAETLKPPCHCGKAVSDDCAHCLSDLMCLLLQTRAEVLEMVVQQIRELQHENSELQSKLKELPRPPSKN